ncbi:MAG: DUF1223 domain-containing protein [Burkholderiales bacterium]
MHDSKLPISSMTRGSFPSGTWMRAGLVAWLALSPMAHAASCEARSGASRVAVLELFTSEGCNSCPPADRWISRVPAREFGPQQILPLAFHVDYWDSLGWKDRFSQSRFTTRQHVHAERNQAKFVYTPQFLLNGQDFRPMGSNAALTTRLASLNSRLPGANLQLRQTSAAHGPDVNLEANLAAGHEEVPAETFLILTEDGLSTDVRAGENSGKKLNHDFVVRDMAGPIPSGLGGHILWKGSFRLASDWKTKNLALTAFVQDPRNGDVLQALHSPVCMDP